MDDLKATKQTASEQRLFQPHRDWKKNESLSKAYIAYFPKQFRWTPATTQNETFLIHLEYRTFEGKQYPFLLYKDFRRIKPRYSGCFPLKVHMDHEEFVAKMKRNFPFPKIIHQLANDRDVYKQEAF